MAKEILKTHGLVFIDRGEYLFARVTTYDGRGMTVSPYGERWRQLRKICTLELLSAKKVQSFLSVREEEVANLVEMLLSLAGTPVNLTQKLLSSTNDITSRAAFGKKCKEKDKFLSLMKEVVELGGGFELEDLFPSLKFLHWISKTKPKLQKLHQQVDKILEDIMNEHRLDRISIRNKARKSIMEEDLVDVLLRLQEENDQLTFPLENNNIKAVITEIFFAGSESSSTTIEWAFSEMMRNPRIMEKAQSEVRHVLRGKTKIGQSDINKLNYMKLIIKETLRLHPVSPLMAPRQSRELCEIDGYQVPSRTKVLVNVWAIARDPEYWSDPETFMPERFHDLSVNYNGSDFEYIPFGAGKRICPGIAFAVANMELQLANLLYHFDWKLPNGVKQEELDMTEHFGATAGRKSNLYLIPTPYYAPLD
ncbi:Cytochrome p450 [Thalictrum thalictroides]|uniref:Cytochrome p450 n=1 Tax=Thalictrum thalictroides TaxID=46969 RepID=A0A7J6VPA8_THATH|nr:Cytochrome p450 [Thalictrum thalictroides]